MFAPHGNNTLFTEMKCLTLKVAELEFHAIRAVVVAELPQMARCQ